MVKRMGRKRNKKATIQDLILIMVIIVGFAVGVLITYKIADELNTKFKEDTRINNTPRATAAFDQITNMYPGVIDNTFLLLVFGLSIGALILAFLVRVHPVFFVGFLLVLVIIIFLAGIFSNIYLEIANTDEFTDVASNLTFIAHSPVALLFPIIILKSPTPKPINSLFFLVSLVLIHTPIVKLFL